MTGKERLAIDMQKARLNAALDDAIKESTDGRSTGDDGEREGIVDTAPDSEQRRVRFTIRSSNGRDRS